MAIQTLSQGPQYAQDLLRASQFEPLGKILLW
jgi:hypothetical protein